MLRVRDIDTGTMIDGVTPTWQGQPLTGVMYDLHLDGWLLSEIEYVDGLQEGTSRDYYPSGQVRSEGMYRGNNADGPEREWFENGHLRREAMLDSAHIVSEKVWDEAGTLVRNYIMTEDDPLYPRLQQFRAYRRRRAEPGP